MTDNLIPFLPGRRKPRIVRAQPDDRHRYANALDRQRRNRDQSKTPIPARITIALDAGGHEGPEVDVACGAVEPAVDLWECGVEQPTTEQVRLLAALTGFPVAFFYRPVDPGPQVGPIRLCGPSGCRLLPPNWIDERGVLHYGGEPRRTPPANFQPQMF